MDIAFKTEQLAAVCNDKRELGRRYGADGKRLIGIRLDDLRAAPSLDAMAKLPAARCEELKGDRAGQLSVRVHGGFRLVFRPAADPPPRKDDGGLDWVAVKAIIVLSIENYHA